MCNGHIVAVSSLKTPLEWAKYIFNMVVNFLSKYRNIFLIYSFDMKFSPKKMKCVCPF